MEINTYTDNVIGETGIVDNLTHNSQTILLDHNYNNPVVFAQPLSYNSSHAAIVRIEDIQGDRFTASIQEPRNLDRKHGKESFSYLVLEEGTWQLEDDTLLEVGTVDTNRLSSKGWENVNFANDFADDPLVFSQVQTDNDQDFVNTRQRNTSNSGFQITMQKEEALNYSGHATETVGWFAIDAGNGNWSQNNYLAGQTGD
ncbi:MAG: peptidase, partial [Cyanobacteria bacterium P01_A01_bin.83]